MNSYNIASVSADIKVLSMANSVVTVHQLILEHLFSDEAAVEDCDETIRCACQRIMAASFCYLGMKRSLQHQPSHKHVQ